MSHSLLSKRTCRITLSLAMFSLLIIGARDVSFVSAATVRTPTFSPASGTYSSPQTITILCGTPLAIIRYTTNGAEPTATSTVYSSPISVNVTTTIKAKGFLTGYTASATATATYTLKVAAPTFSPGTDTYSTPQTVTIKCSTPDATIRYTVDGTVPSSSSDIYLDPIFVENTTAIRAIAFVDGWANSNTASATYTLNFPQVSRPAFSPSGGTYSSAQTVVLTCTTSGATIIYTTDGSDPSSFSTVYSNPILVSVTTTIKVKAFKLYMTDSDIVSATYTISLPKVAKPTFDPVGGVYSSPQTVTIFCSTSGATIRYTTNGVDPTSGSTVYSSPIPVSIATTIKAKAFATGMTASDTVSETYTFKVAAPVFDPDGGTYSGAQSVEIQCSTVGATIRYTINGAEPTSSSPVYSTPIQVNFTTTIRAKAFMTGMTASDTSSETYTIKVATPTFNPAGGNYSSPQTVTILCSTAGATIRYTTNGAEPTSASTVYSGPITVSVSTTIKAKAFATTMMASETASEIYTFKVAAPTFNPESGTYSSTQSIEIRCTTVGATIRYTTNGAEPTSNSPVYSTPILVNVTTTIRAKAFMTGMTASDTSSETCTIKVATPTFNPASGTYSSVQSVTIQCATAGATITYTTDGSEPLSSSTVYLNPIAVGSATTIMAKAFMNGMVDSDVASATYTISIPQEPTKVSTPIISPVGGPYSSPQSVTLRCATSGAIIHYTLDGSEPSSSSPMYADPILVSANVTVKAKAFASDMTSSDTATATYFIVPIVEKVATPTITPAEGSHSSIQRITMKCDTPGAIIRYTTTGIQPSSSSAVYSGPISISAPITIKAKAFMNGMTDSDTTTATYSISPGANSQGSFLGNEVVPAAMAAIAIIAAVAIIAIVAGSLFYGRRKKR